MLISIITATYNSAPAIQNALQSVNEQTYSNIEHLIVDGASKDNTLEVIKSQQNRVSKIVSEPDKGIYDALNKGVKVAKGEIIGFLHSDDVFATKHTLEQIQATFQESQADIVYGDLQYINQFDKTIRYWKSKPFELNLLHKGWMPPHPTVFMKRSVYEKHKCFNLKYKIAADYDYMLRVFQDTSLKFIYVPQVITRMRVGGISNRNLKSIFKKTVEDYLILNQHQFDNAFWLLLNKNFSKLNQFLHR